MSLFPNHHSFGPPLRRARRDLEKLRRELRNLNDQFPATRRFLEMKGLVSVSELDSHGMKDLREYLRGVYKRSVH